MSALSLLPLPWKIGAALALTAALVGAGAGYRHHVYQQGFAAAVDQRAARDLVATVTRVADNAIAATHNTDINRFLTKDKDEKLAPIVRRIYVDRVRVGAAICGPAASTQADDASRGDGADSPGRLVRPDIERDFRALKVVVEQDLATGRTCQAWGREHGFAE